MNSPIVSRSAKTLLVCLLLTLGACQTSGSIPLGRDLPELPDHFKPKAVPDPQAGEPTLSVAARERAGRIANANVITGFRRWYVGVASQFKAGGR